MVDNGEYLVATVVLISAIVVAAVLQALIKIIRGRVGDPDSLKSRFVASFDGPLVLAVLIAGATVAAEIAIDHWQSNSGIDTDLAIFVQRVGSVVVIAIMAFGIVRVSHVIFDWYMRDIATSTSTRLDEQILPSVRRLTPLIVYAIVGLLALATFNIAITPLLATLGIGGIAIALAAQPTLSNFFAGTYVISEGEIHIGDFIEIEGGPSGFVEAISWRSTKVRSRFNNLVIIPNSMMAENMITNYSRPIQAINTIVNGGVSYDSDLPQVEDIIMTAANELVVESEYAVTDSEPRAGFSNFGDSNIDFWVFVQAVDRAGSFQLKSQLIKLIHERFREAGVVINYPMRHLVVDDPPDADSQPSAAEQIVAAVRDD